MFNTHPDTGTFYPDVEGVDAGAVDEHVSLYSENLNPNVPEFIPVITGQEESKKAEHDDEIDECVEAIEDKLKFEEKQNRDEGNADLGESSCEKTEVSGKRMLMCFLV